MARKKQVVTEDVFVTVTMDAEVFNWLNEMIQKKHLLQRYATWIPSYQDMVARAAEQFAAANGGAEEPSPNGDVPHKRVIHRRVAKGRKKR